MILCCGIALAVRTVCCVFFVVFGWFWQVFGFRFWVLAKVSFGRGLAPRGAASLPTLLKKPFSSKLFHGIGEDFDDDDDDDDSARSQFSKRATVLVLEGSVASDFSCSASLRVHSRGSRRVLGKGRVPLFSWRRGKGSRDCVTLTYCELQLVVDRIWDPSGPHFGAKMCPAKVPGTRNGRPGRNN